MNAQATHPPPHAAPLRCPACNAPGCMVGNIESFQQRPDEMASNYFRLDREHGVVAQVVDSPSHRIQGRALLVECFCPHGHHFDLILQDEGPGTVFYQRVRSNTHALTITPPSPVAPPVFFSAACWVAFLHTVKRERPELVPLLRQCYPFQCQEYVVDLNVPKDVVPIILQTLRESSTRAYMNTALQSIMGNVWRLEVVHNPAIPDR